MISSRNFDVLHIPDFLINLLRRCLGLYRHRVHQQHHRVLPVGEMLSNRWEKARFLGFGEGASIYDSAIVFGDVRVGEHTWVGPQVVLDGSSAPLRIGAWCSISAGTQIYTHDSVGWAVTGGRMPYPSAPVSIGSRVYIGPMCTIAKGVTIGDGCIIGAHSFVNADIPSGTLAYGQPAKVHGQVDVDEQKGSFCVTKSPVAD